MASGLARSQLARSSATTSPIGIRLRANSQPIWPLAPNTNSLMRMRPRGAAAEAPRAVRPGRKDPAPRPILLHALEVLSSIVQVIYSFSDARSSEENDAEVLAQTDQRLSKAIE